MSTWIIPNSDSTLPKKSEPVWITMVPKRKGLKPRLALGIYWRTGPHHQSEPEWEVIRVLGDTTGFTGWTPDETVMAWAPIDTPTVYTPE